jgi:hypothetical protein
VILVLYAILTLFSIGVPMLMSRRWRREGPAEEDAEQVPYGPSPSPASQAGAARAGAARAEPRAPAGGSS